VRYANENAYFLDEWLNSGDEWMACFVMRKVVGK
jgi:hypothetical protein